MSPMPSLKHAPKKMSRHDSGHEGEHGSEAASAVRVSFHIAEPYAALLRRHGLDSLDALFASSDGELLSKPGLAAWRQRWRLTLNDQEQRVVLYMKRFTAPPRSARRGISRSGTSSLAGQEWHWIERLRSDGVACMAPVAFGEELRGRREIRSVIVTASAPGRSLETWMKEPTDLDRACTPALLKATADLVSTLHAHGYAHRDLYLSHVFFDPSDQSLRLIDLQRVIRPTWRFSRWVVKDVASLNYSTPARLVSRTDRLRWMRYYLGARKLGIAGKRLAYRVIGKTRQVARRDSRRTLRPPA